MHKPHDAGVYDTPPPEEFAGLMPRDCPTPDGCRPNGCHGACLPQQMDGFVKPMQLRWDERLRAAAEQRPQPTRELWELLHGAATEIERLQHAQREHSRNLALALRKLEQSHTGMWRGDEKAGEVTGYTNGWGDCLAGLKKMMGLGA